MNIINSENSVQDFKKYQLQGAYHWTSLKPSYTTSFNPYLHARYSIALDQIPFPAESTTPLVAVDFGCGDAYFVNQLASRGGYICNGIDGSDKAIELGNAQTPSELKHLIKLKTASVYATGLPENSADLVVSLDVIEHLDHPEKLLHEMKRVAKNGALLLVGTPVRFTEKPTDKYHVQEFFVEEFSALLSSHFTLLDIRKSHPIELLALMRKKIKFGRKHRNLAWNLINIYYLATKKNLLANQNTEFPTYQLGICRVNK